MLKPINTHEFALVIGADTGLWLMPVQYKRIARPQATPKDNVEEWPNDWIKTNWKNTHIYPCVPLLHSDGFQTHRYGEARISDKSG